MQGRFQQNNKIQDLGIDLGQGAADRQQKFVDRFHHDAI
jgi:hypothetical protein